MPEPQSSTIFTRLKKHVGNPLEWREVNKSLLLCAVTLGFVLDYAAISRKILATPEIAPYVNRQVLASVSGALWFVITGWLFLLVIGWWIRRKEFTSSLYTAACLHYLALTDGLICYLMGPWTSPFAFALVLGAGVVGFLLFSRRQMFWALLTFAVVIFGTTLAEQIGKLPAAPLLETLPLAQGKVDLLWIAAIGGLSTMTAAMALAIAAYIIKEWREREEKLQETYLLLHEQKDQLVRAESLAAVGSLVTGAAHELRNPLSSSSALLQSLRDDIRASNCSEEEKKDSLETIDMALKGQRRAARIAERLYSLTDDLVTRGSVSRLSGCVEDLKTAYPGLATEISPDLAALEIPQSLFKAILPNLLDNAVAAGGKEPPRLEIKAIGGILQITVSDSGCGIPPEHRSEVFKPFFTGQKAGEGHGVGLGLYIVHELATRLGGVVELESEEGKGTKVTLRVPLPQST